MDKSLFVPEVSFGLILLGCNLLLFTVGEFICAVKDTFAILVCE